MAAPTAAAAEGAGDPAYWCFLLLGAGTLFPWNALITAADYWDERYPGKHTDRLMTVSYLPANLLVIAAMVHWHGRLMPQLRILGGLLGFTLAICAVPLIDMAPPTTGTLVAVLLLVALCGICDGLAQGALFGEAALLPPRYTQALVAGTAASGVVVSLLRVVTKATLPDADDGLRRSANLYFSLTALVCGACTVVYGYVLPTLPAVRQYRRAALEAALRDGEKAGWKLMLGEKEQAAANLAPPAAADLELSYEDHMQSLPYVSNGVTEQEAFHPSVQPDEHSQVLGLLQGQPVLPSSDIKLRSRRISPLPGAGGSGSCSGGGTVLSSWAVLPMIWPLALANMLIYTVTLSIFPGVLAEDVHSAELGSWYPVALITAFNIADLAGKGLAGLVGPTFRTVPQIVTTTLARVLFIPAFYAAVVSGAHPAIMGWLTFCLGFSNGWLTACAMMEAPVLVPPGAAEQAGNIMVLFLILGLCVGAACGFLWLL